MGVMATDLPPCPECGADLIEYETDDEDSGDPLWWYECSEEERCGWQITNPSEEPLTIMTAPWTRRLALEIERLRELAEEVGR